MLVFLMAHELIDSVRFVMHAKTVNDCCAGFIQTEHFNLDALATEFEHHFIQCCNRSDIPEMGLGQVDGDLLECLLDVEDIGEFVCGAEEHLAHNTVSPVRFSLLKTAIGVQVMPDFVGGEQRTLCAYKSLKRTFFL